MPTSNIKAPSSLEDMLTNMPDGMRGQPLTVGRFLQFLGLLVKSNKALQQRVAQLEQQAGAKGGNHG